MTTNAAVQWDSAFPEDTVFPQLKVASDPARMLDVFRAHLKPAAGRVLHIQDCVPFRFRCRQAASRCVLQYTLRVVEPTTGRSWDQWVTGVIYAESGEAERLWRELAAADPAHETPARWRTFEPVGFIPGLGMLVEVFPFDRKLTHLRRVMTDAWRAIEPLLLARLGPGGWRTEDRAIEPTRYRTELGAALRYTLRARRARALGAATVRCYLKVYRNDHGAATYNLLRALADRAGNGRGYGAVAPLAYLPELRTLALEEAPGTPLQHLLVRGGDPTPVMRVVARAVAAFNQDDVGVTREHRRADQLDDVEEAAAIVQWACPDLASDVRALAAAVVADLDDAPPAPIHRDLKTDHVFLHGERVIFIDLDSVALGDPVRDPAHLFAHVASRVGLDTMPPQAARAAAVAFKEEYFGAVPAEWRRRFPLHAAGALLEVARGIFKRQEPRWPDKVRAAVEAAGRELGWNA